MLDVAKRLFIERGYSGTTMEDIAEEAGFGVATLYNYFRKKEGIFATMAREDMTVLEQAGGSRTQPLARQPDRRGLRTLACLQPGVRVHLLRTHAGVPPAIPKQRTTARGLGLGAGLAAQPDRPGARPLPEERFDPCGT